MSSGPKLNAVFYADSYHPIQAGSIDGTDILPHDNAIYRAQLCSSAGLYDPFGDPKVAGDPYCSLFVGNLSRFTNEDSLHKAMSKYGRVKNMRLVRHIGASHFPAIFFIYSVTGASRGYAFVEYETEKEMRRAYEEAHHSLLDDYEILVDYNRQQLMPGWIPRRLGGGLGGKKESGQLRFGGRERPFKAPLRPIPLDDLKRLGIPPPPEGRYMSRYQIPSPPRRKQSSIDRDDPSHDRSSMDREESSRRRHSRDREQARLSKDRGDHSRSRRSVDREERSHRKSSSTHKKESSHKRRYDDNDGTSHRKSSGRNEEKPEKHRKRDSHSRPGSDRSRRSTSRDRSFGHH